MFRAAIALLIIALGLLLINKIFVFAWIMTLAKICLVLVIVLIVLKMVSFLFGGL